VQISQGKLRALLAALLLNPNRAVSVDELLEALWGVDPPPSARVGVQNYVMQLRRTLGAAGTRITTQPPGYLIKVEPGELDVVQFEMLVRDARAAARGGDWAKAAAKAAAALSLWRGEPLADIDSDLLTSRDRPRLAELHAAALQTRIDADLRAGLHREVISELKQLIAADPLRERWHGLLMLALYRDGRQGEALETYLHARRVLVEELGTEPGVELQELHQQVLAADPALAAPPDTGARAEVVPRELPAPVGHFTGRAAELAALTQMIEQPGGRSSTLVISAIGGTAGVGKTALAVHWAHQVVDRFPDGQLYVNLRGYDPDRPMPAADALGGFLTSLGGLGKNLPAGIEERASRYRSLLAGKRVLVVLDNAGSVEQVRPLLPGSAGCAVLVTSRDALAGLVARDGAVRVDLDLLPADDAIRLLSTLIGERVDADPVAAEILADRCARLPLALRVAAELAVARPTIPLADLVADLTENRTLLDELDAGGDPRTAVREVFSWSYRSLDPESARAFRLAGLHPGADFEAYAVSALTGTSLDRARHHIDVLVRAHLIQPASHGRYGMHDLLRDYARDRAAAHDGEAGTHAAITRLFDHYLHTADTAIDTLYPARRELRPHIPAPASPRPTLADAVAALCWLEIEEDNLIAVATAGADNGWPSHAIGMTRTLFQYLQDANSPHEIAFFAAGVRAANQLGDSADEAQALNGLAGANWRLGRYAEAEGLVTQALALYREIGHKVGQAHALQNLGTLKYQQGSFEESAEYHRKAVDLQRQVGDVGAEAGALNCIAIALHRLGRYSEADGHYRQALVLAREIGDRRNEAFVLTNIGELARQQGYHQQAIDYHHQSLAIFRELGNRSGEGNVLSHLGVVALMDGRFDQAVGYHLQALEIARQTGAIASEAHVLNALGEALLAAGRVDDALTHLAMALAIASEISEKYHQARALEILGSLHRAAGRQDEARAHWLQALDLYSAAGVPEADKVRAQLAELEAATTAKSSTQDALATE
jgi:DNA-binding SARP family transcriptional activator/Tfp pilus assembly protein PilF